MQPKIAQMRTPKSTYTMDYPVAIEAAKAQFQTLWSAEELGVEKDEHDVRVNLTAGERHGLSEVLKLFTKYELRIGDDFWASKYQEMFPRPDLCRAANAFSYTEVNSHAPFYDLINKTLGLATDEFYDSWKNDPVLVERIGFVDSYLATDDPYKALAAFSFMEGAVLYSSFAFLKSFNMNGFNMIPHITAGVDISCKEEHSHFMFSSWSYRQLQLEEEQLGLIGLKDKLKQQTMCKEIAQQVYEHESRIIELIFSEGDIRTITKAEILQFVRDRINIVLQGLDCPVMFEEPSGDISDWFYSTLSAYKYADHFANNQIQYVRNWSKAKLAWPEGEIE